MLYSSMYKYGCACVQILCTCILDIMGNAISSNAVLELEFDGVLPHRVVNVWGKRVSWVGVE